MKKWLKQLKFGWNILPNSQSNLWAPMPDVQLVLKTLLCHSISQAHSFPQIHSWPSVPLDHLESWQVLVLSDIEPGHHLTTICHQDNQTQLPLLIPSPHVEVTKFWQQHIRRKSNLRKSTQLRKQLPQIYMFIIYQNLLDSRKLLKTYYLLSLTSGGS